jgi:hypothetical protein
MGVVGDVAQLLRTQYVFSDRGRAAAAELAARETSGAYAGLDDEALSARLTADLDELCPRYGSGGGGARGARTQCGRLSFADHRVGPAVLGVRGRKRTRYRSTRPSSTRSNTDCGSTANWSTYDSMTSISDSEIS